LSGQIQLSEQPFVAERNALLRATAEFDADWYVAQYPEVGASGISPREHFLQIGEAMGRSPGPRFDTAFYTQTYRVWHPSQSPLADYLTAKEQCRRPTTPGQLARDWDRLGAETTGVWGAEGPLQVSYCIPVMDRFADISGTLQANLKENARHADHIEFLVILFGPSNEVVDWIEDQSDLVAALERGYLRVIQDTETLDSWHFGKAKNAFRPHLRGKVYSSLDADNFVTAEETDWLLDVAEENPSGFVAHHFSGDFGDGTCGRVSMPARLYRHIGYDPRLLPRQWDEMDFMVGALKTCPAAPLIMQEGANIATIGSSFVTFLDIERMPNRRLTRRYPIRRKPLNPQGVDYMQRQPDLVASELFNSNQSALNWTISDHRKEVFSRRAQNATHALLRDMPTDRLVSALFNNLPELPTLANTDLPLFASVKNEAPLLPRFLSHYRQLGVTHFFLIDDGSEIPVSELNLGEDVTVLQTKTGQFQVAKALWLQAAAKAVTREGAWLLTVDADELVQLPARFSTFADLIAELDRTGKSFAPGLLLDMLPSDPSFAVDPSQPFDTFDSFCWRDDLPVRDYFLKPSVDWGFGLDAPISWRVDVRYHAFGTFDSLRKIPLLKYRHDWFFNQGFHTLRGFDGYEHNEITPKMFEDDILLPIFHYKLSKLWEDSARQEMLAKSVSYDGQTAQNIKKIFETDDQKQALIQLKPFLRPAAEARSIDFRRLDGTCLENAPRNSTPDCDERPILLLAFQRTGSTTLARRLFERSRFPWAKKHEPFVGDRPYSFVTRRLRDLADAKRLEPLLEEIFGRQQCLKHCLDVVPFELTTAMVAAARCYDYKIVFLYRRSVVDRLASAAYAAEFQIWGPENLVGVNDVPEAKGVTLSVSELLKRERRLMRYTNKLWTSLGRAGAAPLSVAFEDVFGPDLSKARAELARLCKGLRFDLQADEIARFCSEVRATGEQGTRQNYVHMQGLDRLARGARRLPGFRLDA